MMNKNRKTVLIIDASINLILGVLLLAYSPVLISILGVPSTDNYFYPNILGAVLIGIAIALVIEAFRKDQKGGSGLGLYGAVSINLCGGLVLLYWLLFGRLDIPAKGLIFLWVLDIILVLISSTELFINLKNNRDQK
jgi:hypothetical protein